MSTSLLTTDRLFQIFTWQNHGLIWTSLVTTDRWLQILSDKTMFWSQHPHWQVIDDSKFQLTKWCFELSTSLLTTERWFRIFTWQNNVLISTSLVTTDRWFQILSDKIVFWSQHPHWLRTDDSKINFNCQSHVLISTSLLTTERRFQILTDKVMSRSQHLNADNW